MTKNTNALPITADDWQLYDLPGRGKAAKALTAALRRGLKLPTALAAYEAWHFEAMRQREFGATDTEPRHEAVDAIERRFGRDDEF